ncbi:solute carrier family 12 member 8 isoform X4 [Oxyura jamaicensis]|uniref:solute carrier family 12 member 8 isoform X4 n=1 Tax=Oxyura jamaicensis TaxID=8884 RepID=UPI0015A53BA0|nr:solute carrier family 12 member 8 isoform X4 [Oxyura jamaicensis]
MSGLRAARSEGYVQELFHEEAQQVSQTQTRPWWKIQLFVWEPVLFGTWDGVFTSCMINIFGVVLFLRTGWLVGNTGVVMGMFLVSFVVLVALVTVLSGIGVCERCSIGSGGVYSMISTVLGGQVGGTIGFLYIFGQCVAGAMYITGFAESIADVLNLSNIWAVRGISLAVLLGLLGINLAGVKWIIRLQLLLLLLLAVSTLDFVIGSFSHLDPEHGFVGYSEELLFNNTLPDYSQGESFFTVFGVFFPAATGVMAGFNMSGDLQKPATNIPLGSLAAIGTSWFLYMVFVFLLGAICTRQSLRYDFMIAEKKGPNRTPVAAICLTSLITMAFVFIGQVNVLAPIVTINFMLTYIAVDYSYFSISLCYDDQQKAGKTQVENTKPPHSSQPLIFNKPSSHASDGVIQSRSNGTLLEFTKDMDQLFKPFRNEPSASKKGAESLTQNVKQKKVKKPAKQTLQDSFLLDLDHDAPPAQYGWDETAEPHHESYQDLAEQGHQLEVGPCWSPAADTQGTPELLEQGEQLRSQAPELRSQRVEGEGRVHCNESQEKLQCNFPWKINHRKAESSVRQQNLELGIQQIPESFYSRFCNHWVSFAGAIVSLIIMFVIQWIYTLVSLGAAVILYFYIGQVSPGLPLGAAANFSLFSWIKSALITSCRRRPSPKEQIVVTPAFATVGMETTQLTEENADFASRDRYHQSSLISREEFVNQFQ